MHPWNSLCTKKDWVLLLFDLGNPRSLGFGSSIFLCVLTDREHHPVLWVGRSAANKIRATRLAPHAEGLEKQNHAGQLRMLTFITRAGVPFGGNERRSQKLYWSIPLSILALSHQNFRENSCPHLQARCSSVISRFVLNIASCLHSRSFSSSV